LAVAALVLSWLQYTFVETPFRQGWNASPKRAWLSFAAMTGVLILSAIPAVAAKLIGARPGVDLSPNPGLAATCSQAGPAWRDLPACRTSPTPVIAIWGDSNAMHLAPGLADLPIVQMTKSACGPILGIAQIDAEFSESWARQCSS